MPVILDRKIEYLKHKTILYNTPSNYQAVQIAQHIRGS